MGEKRVKLEFDEEAEDEDGKNGILFFFFLF